MIDRLAHVKIGDGYCFCKTEDGFGYLVTDNNFISVKTHLNCALFDHIKKNPTVHNLISELKEQYSEPQILFELMNNQFQGYISICPLDLNNYTINSYFDTCVNEILKPDILADILLPCVSYYDSNLIKRIQNCIQAKKTCVPVKLTGNKIWVGPLFGNNGCCPYCMEYILMQNNPILLYIKRKGGDIPVPECNLNNSEIENRVELVLESIRKLPVSEISILTIDPKNAKRNENYLRKIPQCPNCGNQQLFEIQVKSPVSINKHGLKKSKIGGFREYSPDETWNRLETLINPVTGAVISVEPVKGKDHPVRPVWKADFYINPYIPLNIKGESFVRNSLGKGQTAKQARVSALGEALERYCALFNGSEPVISGTLIDLQQYNPVSPLQLLNFSDKQYVCKNTGGIHDQAQNVPPRFSDDELINWTYAWSLTHNQKRLLPLTYCYCAAPFIEKECFCPFSSNGNASGNTLEEAILQGLMELIERDAVAIWWYNRIKRPAIDLSCFNESYFTEVIGHYKALGYEVWVLNVTGDLGIPVMVALARHGVSKEYLIGMGAHLDMKIAVQRALTELHQVFTPDSPHQVWNESEIENPDFLFPDNSTGVPKEFTLKTDETTIGEDVLNCVNILAKKRLDTIVLNYTRPDIGFPAVKVIVPGLRHIWRRLGRGRLYDVPVQLGWLKNSLNEENLNPLTLSV